VISPLTLTLTISLSTNLCAQANEIIPSLASAYFTTFKDELSGIDSLHQAINYYQVAIVQTRPEHQAQLRLELGNVYLELMYYADEVENEQLAIDCFEWILKRFNQKKVTVEATNGKSQGWWWKLVTEGEPRFFKENEESPFRTWTKNMATAFRDDATSVCYYALSSWWIEGFKRDQLVWLQLAWTLLQSKRQSAPPAFYYIYVLILYSSYLKNKRGESGDFGDFPTLLSALQQVGLFSTTVTLKDIYMIQRCVMIHFIEASRTYHIDPKYVSFYMETTWADSS
jgi:hypothetical protein